MQCCWDLGQRGGRLKVPDAVRQYRDVPCLARRCCRRQERYGVSPVPRDARAEGAGRQMAFSLRQRPGGAVVWAAGVNSVDVPRLARNFGKNLRAIALAAAELKDTGAGLDNAVLGSEDVDVV